MAWADETTAFVKTIKLVEEEIKNAISATENLQTNAASVTLDMDTFSLAQQGAVTNAAAQARSRREASIRALARAILDVNIARMGAVASSPFVENGAYTSFPDVMRDIRNYMDDTVDQKVSGRAVTFASDPAASTVGVFKRLTVDYRGQKIESGRHNQTITAKIIQTVLNGGRAHSSKARIYGATRGIDGLDYQTGSGDANAIEIDAMNELGLGSLLINSNLTGNADTSDNAAVTAATGWALAGTGTLLIEKTAAKIWRSNSFSLSFSGAALTKSFEQTITGLRGNRFRPTAVAAPIYMNAGWTGDITVEWGGKSQGFTETDLTSGGWKVLVIDMDSDLYPINWDEDTPTVKVTLASDAGRSEELVIGGIYMVEGVQHEGVFYFHFSNTDDAVLNGSVTWVDSANNTGEIQDTLAWAYEDEFPGDAYLPTTGTSTLADPA